MGVSLRCAVFGRVLACVVAVGLAVVGLASAGNAAAAGYTSVQSFGSGLLGDPNVTSRAEPGKITALSGVQVIAVATYPDHTLALSSGGKVFAWGHNDHGQLGDGSTTDRTVPTQISFPVRTARVVAIATGYQFSMAMTSTGQVLTWGASGQLGDGTTRDRALPAAIALPGAAVARSISAGYAHAAVATTTGAVFTWGYNSSGQLGDGTTTDSVTPVRTLLPSGFVATSVAAGSAHTLALGSTGTVMAWGSNFNGELGTGRRNLDNGGITPSPVATKLPKGVSAVAVTTCGGASAVLSSAGQVITWGQNDYDQLGYRGTNGALVPQNGHLTVVTLPDGATAKTISMGRQSVLVSSTANAVYGWGYNPTIGLTYLPQRISTPSGTVTAVSAGGPADYIVVQN